MVAGSKRLREGRFEVKGAAVAWLTRPRKHGPSGSCDRAEASYAALGKK